MAFTCFWLVVPPVLACSGFVGNWTLRRLKERITLPRAGYARFKQPPAWAKVIVALAILAVVFAPVGDTESTRPPLVMALVSLGMLREGGRARNGRFLILAAISLGLGVWVWRTRAGWIGLTWAFLWLGAAALVTGALRLRRFLRENPKVAETEA